MQRPRLSTDAHRGDGISIGNFPPTPPTPPPMPPGIPRGDGLSREEADRAEYLLRKADLLVPRAHATALSVRPHLAREHPMFAPIHPDHWTFVTMVSAIWSAVLMVEKYIPPALQPEVMRRVGQHAVAWRAESLHTMDELSRFTLRRMNDDWDNVLVPAVGMWTFWTLMGRPPAQAHAPAVRSLARRFCLDFSGYWTALPTPPSPPPMRR